MFKCHMPDENIADSIVQHIDRTLSTVKSMNNFQPTSPVVHTVIYDIDNTLLDESGGAIKSIVSTYKHALRRNLKPIIITARMDLGNVREVTVKQLHDNGITHYEALFLMPQTMTDPSIYKFNVRRYLHTKGYRAIASIGDMPHDLGLYGGTGFLVTERNRNTP